MSVGTTAELIFEAPPALLPLPFEAARLPDGRLPALEEGVCVLRRLQADHRPPPAADPPPAGPLKILVAVGAPDEGKTPNQVLDLEGELQAIFDAVDRASRSGNAQVRVLEVGDPEEIRRALTEDAFHVLHLSAHGGPGVIELETEDGDPQRVSAEALARSLREAGRPLPLVFLSSCHGGVASSETASFAQGLLEAGVPRVVSMQSTVSDAYASNLAGEVYEELMLSRDRPLVSRALARARRNLEQARLQAIARGEPAHRHQPEYATASLFCLGEETPILDPGLKGVPLSIPPVHRVEGPVPQLSLGELIGRRRELRETLRILRDHPKAVAKYGRRAGVVLTGLGGVGKSCLAGRAMARLKEAGWAVAATRDRFDLGEIANATAAALRQSGWPDIEPTAHSLESSDLVDVQKLPILTGLLQTHKLALILDNFETNLTTGGDQYRDPVVHDLLRTLCEAAETGRLLLTCRYPPPGLSAWLQEAPVGPLSPAQSRKLLLRLPGLRDREPAELAAILRRIGGHPRMLEYVDALVQGGAARLPRVRALLEAEAEKAGVTLGDSAGNLDEATRDALLVGAQDILLHELLTLAEATGDRETLHQAAVSALPWTLQGLAHALHDREATSEEVAKVHASTRRLTRLSLLTPLADKQVWVHRWTAESLRASSPPADHRELCRRAGEYRMWRVTAETHSLNDGMEAVDNFLDAEAFDRAAREAIAIAQALERARQLVRVATFANEVLRRLPEDHGAFAFLADQEGQALEALGYTEQALKRYEQLLSAHRGRSDLEPERADYQRDLSVSYNKVGDLQSALGQGEAARQAYERSLAIIERLAAAEPDRADYQRDLSVAYNKVGDLQRALGQGEAARQAYERSLAIRERLAAAEPDRADYQRDLSALYDRLARLVGEEGAAADALAFRRRDLQIAERLWAGEPGRADLTKDLAISLLETARLSPEEGPELIVRMLQILQPLAAENRLGAQGMELLDLARKLASALEGGGKAGSNEAAEQSGT